MKQLVIDIPFQQVPADLFPAELLEKSTAVRVLRIDLEGFLFTFRIPKSEADGLVKILRGRYPRVKISRIRAVGVDEWIIRASGGWWKSEDGSVEDTNVYRRLKALEKSQTYFLKSPEVVGKFLRLTLAGDPKSVRHFQKTFKSIGINYQIRKLSELEEASDSPLGILTATQLRILRLAHARGYYDLPRKTDTMALASLLQIDKGTVGRHMRRAEKHIMDQLLT